MRGPVMMRAYGWVFLATGAVFVVAPGPLTGLLGLPNGGTGLWLGLAGSLMAVLSLLSFQIAEDPLLDSRWNLLLLSKLVSTALFLAFALLSRNPAFLIGAFVDAAIFLHLAVLRAGVRFGYRGRTGPAQEAWFVMVRDPATGRGFWARYARTRDRAECRAVLFDKAAGRVASERWERPLWEIESGPATAYHLDGFRLARGRAAGPTWALTWPDAEIGTLGFTPPLLAGAGLVRAGYEAVEGLVRVSGEAAVDGLSARFDRAPGGVGHLWSPGGARSWRWARAVFERPEGTTVFEILTAAAPLPGGPSVPMTAARLVHQGRSLSSVGALASLSARSELRDGQWTFRVGFGGVVAEGRCRLDERLAASFPYDAPGGGGVCRTSMTGFLSLTLREGGFLLAELETPDGAVVELAQPAA